MLTLNWSFLNFLGYSGHPGENVTINLLFLFPLTGEKQQVEMKLRVIASLVGLGLLIGYEIIDTVLPRRNLTEFRTIYLAQEKKVWRGGASALINDVRINIMHVRRPWYTMFLGRFYWTWNDGFDPPHQKDANMLLLTFQGVAGTAYRSKEPKAVDFRPLTLTSRGLLEYGWYFVWPTLVAIAAFLLYLLVRSEMPGIYFYFIVLVFSTLFVAIKVLRLNQFYLWPWQAKKASNVKFILSVPLFRASQGDSKTFKPVGVINLDTTTEAGAAFLQANEGRLVTYFLEIGKVIACLR